MRNIMLDNEISFKSKGVYVAIEYLIDNSMEVSVSSLLSMSSDGERLIRTAINELIEKGYVKRETIREKNRIKGIKYQIIK